MLFPCKRGQPYNNHETDTYIWTFINFIYKFRTIKSCQDKRVDNI